MKVIICARQERKCEHLLKEPGIFRNGICCGKNAEYFILNFYGYRCEQHMEELKTIYEGICLDGQTMAVALK